MRIVLALVSVFVVGLFSLPARADIMISPIYVIFDDRDRSAEVTLLNTTNETNVYRLEWSFTRQREDGSYEKIENVPPGEINPGTFIRFSPRQVTLLPQSRQNVRLQLQKPADLPDGEYRVHLNFKRLPNDNNMDKSPDVKGVNMQLRVMLGVSMPVIVRQGKYAAEVKITDARFVNKKEGKDGKPIPELMVRVDRSGKFGTYGRLRVFWQDGQTEKQIGILNNFSIYADNADRIGYVRLTTSNIPSGKIRIVYEGDGPQRGQVFTEQTINIGK